jgi:hypothetical protein
LTQIQGRCLFSSELSFNENLTRLLKKISTLNAEIVRLQKHQKLLLNSPVDDERNQVVQSAKDAIVSSAARFSILLTELTKAPTQTTKLGILPLIDARISSLSSQCESCLELLAQFEKMDKTDEKE